MMKEFSIGALALGATLFGAPAFAADTHLGIPGQSWEIRFDAPAYNKIDEQNLPNQYRLSGNDGRFTLSYYFEPPRCDGGMSKEAIYNCFNASLQHNPLVVYSTERANRLEKGVAVMYMTQADVDGRKVSSFNVNVLFARDGKWGDLHVSYVSPQAADIQTLFKVAQSFDIVDVTPAPSSTASAPN